jgi:methylenetetrahydrofolate dehydrogenase (NADP+)/methenyltetrahydrofolate cyclohydrolase
MVASGYLNYLIDDKIQIYKSCNPGSHMLLQTKDLIEQTTAKLVSERALLTTKPGLALIWVGNDAQTKSFVRVKQQKAKLLDCEFFLYHLESAGLDQLVALMKSLNKKKEVHGIVLQLPLPSKEWAAPLIEAMAPEKDIDHLRSDSPYDAPTPSGILAILEHNNIDPAKENTVILGAGRLVGAPLAEIFTKRNWSFSQIRRRAIEHRDEIRKATLVISATGVEKLVTPELVGPDAVVIDGSGIDVDVVAVEAKVRAVSPSKGAVGPMTVCQLFRNLLTASQATK